MVSAVVVDNSVNFTLSSYTHSKYAAFVHIAFLLAVISDRDSFPKWKSLGIMADALPNAQPMVSKHQMVVKAQTPIIQ